jgi:hypothetical protein
MLRTGREDSGSFSLVSGAVNGAARPFLGCEPAKLAAGG